MPGDSDERSYRRALKDRDYSTALATAQRAVTNGLAGRRGLWLTRVGTAMVMLGRHGDACEAYTAALKLTRLSASDLYNLGIACNEIGRYEEAVDHYRAAAALAPQDARIHNNLGKSLNRLGRLAEAETSL